MSTHNLNRIICLAEPTTELIGRTLVVAPGSLSDDGRFAVADLHAREAEASVLAEVA